MPSGPPAPPPIPPGWFDAPPPERPRPPVVPRKPMGRGPRTAILVTSLVAMLVLPLVALVALFFAWGAQPPCGALNHTNDCTEEQAADIAHEQDVAMGVFLLSGGGSVTSFVVFLVTAASFDGAAIAVAQRRALGV